MRTDGFTPIGIPVYIVDIQRVHSCGTCIWFLQRTSFTMLCDFWLWNALRLCFCGCFQKIDNEMNSDENWWLMMICLLNTPIHPHWQHDRNNWHLKQKMRLFNPSSWRWCLPNFWCLPCWWSVLGNWAGWWSISFGLLWRRIALGRKLPFHSYLEGMKVKKIINKLHAFK